MIYLIGGPPKCGKTTLAKKISESTGIPWVSTDTLQCVIKPYINKKEYSNKFPTNYQKGKNNDEKYSKYSTKEIIEAYRQQAKTSYQAIDMFAICEITEGNNFIIEGYHIEPELVARLNKKYPNKIKSIFLVKSDQKKFVSNIKNSTTPNDWIIARTKEKKTYGKIADMVIEYGKYFEIEAKKNNFDVINMDDNFDNQIKKALNSLMIP